MTSEEPLLTYIQRHWTKLAGCPTVAWTCPTQRRPEDEMRWAPGALDGVLGHHGEPGDKSAGQGVAELLVDGKCTTDRRAPSHPPRRPRRSERAEHRRPLIDELVRLGRESPRSASRYVACVHVTQQRPGQDRPRAAGRNRTPQTCGCDPNTWRARRVHSLCGDRTANGLRNPDSELWALAASVDGWGRIQCVIGCATPETHRSVVAAARGLQELGHDRVHRLSWLRDTAG